MLTRSHARIFASGSPIYLQSIWLGIALYLGCGAPPRQSPGNAPVIVLGSGPQMAGAPSTNAAQDESRDQGIRSCPADMILIQGGTFRMGERGDQVKVRDFCLDITEVTAGAFFHCTSEGRCTEEGTRCASGATFGDPEKLNHPMNCVNHGQAVAFCEARRKRLPTEEEWEWAARGGPLGRPYPWGDAPPENQLCWSGKQTLSSTCPVGYFRNGNSAHGIADLAGNMYEWTSSIFKGTDDYVLRGGSWPGMLAPGYKASSRAHSSADSQTNNYGFRCAR